MRTEVALWRECQHVCKKKHRSKTLLMNVMSKGLSCCLIDAYQSIMMPKEESRNRKSFGIWPNSLNKSDTIIKLRSYQTDCALASCSSIFLVVDSFTDLEFANLCLVIFLPVMLGRKRLRAKNPINRAPNLTVPSPSLFNHRIFKPSFARAF